ncbi:MFS transporter [Nocardia sp. 004]|uniref:MFS transporter n=1 Tax=Nocardia sp. 004 TaxID=3385978 RepID=UPI0039A1A253
MPPLRSKTPRRTGRSGRSESPMPSPGHDTSPPPEHPSRRLLPHRAKPPRHTDPPEQPETTVQESADPAETPTLPGTQRIPRKITVTRVAAMRSRELTEKGIATFQRAAKADGADKSGLTALTYATMANFALDAAIAVSLANTLFFASATAESKTKVALYLLITIAPFAVIAPLIGPMLDRLQRGRRLALATSFAVRAIVAVALIIEFDTWALYPLALCMMIGSKSFSVLKSAVTPRVLPPDIDLVRTNSRLTVFGLVGGTIGAGALAGLIAAIAGSGGALVLATTIAGIGTYLSLRIPSWVEVTEGEVPATLSYHGADAHTEVLSSDKESAVPPRKRRQPLGRAVVTGLWGNGAIRVLTGFLTFYIAFVAKATEHRPMQQAAMLGAVGVAAAIGNFAGNATGARLTLGRPALIVLGCTATCALTALFATFADNLLGAAVAAAVAAAMSALAKVSLDAAIQDDLPPESIASGFGRSETVLQLSWVIGGAAGVLLPTEYWKGFAVITAVLVLGSIQTLLTFRGHSLLPGLGGNRPQHAEQEVPTSRSHGDPRHQPHAHAPAPRHTGDTAHIQHGQGDPIW